MMKALLLPTLASLALVGEATSTPFLQIQQQHHAFSLFGIRGGSEAPMPDEEYHRAVKVITDAVTNVEQKVQKAVEAEVDTLFHEMEHHEEKKEIVTKAAQKAVKKGAKKIKESVEEHESAHVYPFEDHPYPYAFPQINRKNKPHEHRDHRILHAVEKAEHALLHAIEQEVDTIFHEAPHHENVDDHKVAAKTVKEGLKKTKKHVKEDHEQRRGWLSEQGHALIEEYTSPDMFFE